MTCLRKGVPKHSSCVDLRISLAARAAYVREPRRLLWRERLCTRRRSSGARRRRLLSRGAALGAFSGGTRRSKWAIQLGRSSSFPLTSGWFQRASLQRAAELRTGRSPVREHSRRRDRLVHDTRPRGECSTLAGGCRSREAVGPRCCANHVAASEATCSSAPGSSKR